MIRLGPAGSGLANEQGFKLAKKLGFNAIEVEFTYGVWMKPEEAEILGKLAKEFNLKLSIHAPYYINLASKEKQKVHASKQRILKSCEIANLLGAEYVVFHAGFYQSRNPEEVYQIIKKELINLQEKIKQKSWKVKLCPETTGKTSQFGTLDELLRLKKEIKTFLCIDFAHLLARKGKINYEETISKIKGIKNLHAHFSGIVFGEKGEKRHRLTTEEDLIALLKELKKQKVDITIINESPDPVNDTLLAKRILEKI